MMRPLIIIAHPQGNSSHIRHAFDHVKRRLDKAGVDYDVIDLYAEEFDPVMRDGKQPRKHHQQVERYRKLIDGTDRIIVLYPVWWNGPPAILKGFFDCMLIPGWSYHYQQVPIFKKVGLPIGHLRGKRAAIVSTSGSPDILHRLVQHSRAGRIIGHDILRFVGMRTRRWNVGGCQKYAEENLPYVERACNRALGWLGLVRDRGEPTPAMQPTGNPNAMPEPSGKE